MKKERSLHYMFFTEEIEESFALLNEEETRHAINVLRIKEGEIVSFTNGSGWHFEGIFRELLGKKMKIEIVNKYCVNRNIVPFIFCIGLPEKEAFEEALVNLTSLGVTKIVPVISEYSEKGWNKSDWNKYSLRFRKKMISALKQSLSCHLPFLMSPITLQEATSNIEDIAFVADINGIILKDIFYRKEGIKSIICFIGPPGGFSEKEISYLKEKGALLVKIASNRLRTELAATVLCAQIIEKIIS